ncbi:cystinosin homolog isoform X2 [Octopus sinensis]|uniref:Cystinosin homolog isoform X2 n=1 Tax=Octopus sinensis TaxID=2607531 RepID=A0A7E6EYW6_9MOLL|nr:cystinosin homolog isoform X2 [Octopus sinensis]
MDIHHHQYLPWSSKPLVENVPIYFDYEYHKSFVIAEKLKIITPLRNVTLEANNKTVDLQLIVQVMEVGHLVITANTNSSNLSVAGAFVRVDIKHSHALYILNIIVGWIYFIVWTVSFYPQAILNYKRKSVVGLNFDFAGYNLIGFLAYGMFNAFLYWDPAIQKLYFHDNPYGILPVQLNDVVFTIHATLISLFTIGQIYVYERGTQKVSKIGQVIIILMMLFIFISLIVAGAKAINWLQFLYYLSYVKLFVTFIKYIPQCHMNCVRRSTEGWSIWGVLMDFTGGTFSILQMFLLSYNNDDWKSIFGDPTKFGLGVFSIAFDIIFCLQHYFFQKNNKYKPLIQT